MDSLWALGWRHFGAYFFRYSAMSHDGRTYHVIPLRIELSKFDLSQSQTRVLRRHRDRVKNNVPNSLFDFMSAKPAVTPCRNEEICVYRDEQLLAMSFLDIG